jgi:hypothetical protein
VKDEERVLLLRACVDAGGLGDHVVDQVFYTAHCLVNFVEQLRFPREWKSLVIACADWQPNGLQRQDSAQFRILRGLKSLDSINHTLCVVEGLNFNTM